jgi:hypothetical protein
VNFLQLTHPAPKPLEESCARTTTTTTHPPFTPFETTIVKQSSKMAEDAPVTLRTRKFIRNPLLGRKQMVV